MPMNAIIEMKDFNKYWASEVQRIWLTNSFWRQLMR